MLENEITRTAFYDDVEDRLTIKSTQDIESILKKNEALRNDKSQTRTEEFWHVASIPFIVVEQWAKEGINVLKKEDWPKVVAKLNNGDYKYLRTDEARL